MCRLIYVRLHRFSFIYTVGQGLRPPRSSLGMAGGKREESIDRLLFSRIFQKQRSDRITGGCYLRKNSILERRVISERRPLPHPFRRSRLLRFSAFGGRLNATCQLPPLKTHQRQPVQHHAIIDSVRCLLEIAPDCAESPPLRSLLSADVPSAQHSLYNRDIGPFQYCSSYLVSHREKDNYIGTYIYPRLVDVDFLQCVSLWICSCITVLINLNEVNTLSTLNQVKTVWKIPLTDEKAVTWRSR